MTWWETRKRNTMCISDRVAVACLIPVGGLGFLLVVILGPPTFTDTFGGGGDELCIGLVIFLVSFSRDFFVNFGCSDMFQSCRFLER